MEQRNNAKHSVKGDVTAIDIRPQKGLVFVVMHGYFCLSGAVIDGRRTQTGGGENESEWRLWCWQVIYNPLSPLSLTMRLHIDLGLETNLLKEETERESQKAETFIAFWFT